MLNKHLAIKYESCHLNIINFKSQKQFGVKNQCHCSESYDTSCICFHGNVFKRKKLA